MQPEDLSTAAAAPENAAQEEPQAAQREESKAATPEKDAGAADAADHSSSAGDKPRAKAKAQKRGGNGSRATASDTGPSDQTPRLQEQLLARLTVPPVTCDRRLLPATLIKFRPAAILDHPSPKKRGR